MKILHLADLHLGKILLEQSLIEDQEYMLNQIIEKIKENEIDVILIAGDIYDKNIPSLEAINLFDNFLNVLIKRLNKKVFIIAGNHDSKDRLAFGNKIFEEERSFY
jgi:exonuclease SbcD